MFLNHSNFCMCYLASAVNHSSTCKLKTQPTYRWPEHWSAWGFTLTWQAVHKALKSKQYFSRSGNLYPHAPTTLSIQHPTGPLRCSFNPAVKPQIWASPPATQIDPVTTGIHRFTNVVTHRLKTFYLFIYFIFWPFEQRKWVPQAAKAYGTKFVCCPLFVYSVLTGPGLIIHLFS